MDAEHVDITLILDGRVYAVYTPYNAKALLSWRAIPGRRFVRDQADKGLNLVPISQKRALWALLGQFYPGHDVHYCVGAVGQQGREFRLPGVHPVAARLDEQASQERWEQEQVENDQASDRATERYYEEGPRPEQYWGAGEEEHERQCWAQEDDAREAAQEEQRGAYGARFDGGEGE